MGWIASLMTVLAMFTGQLQAEENIQELLNLFQEKPSQELTYQRYYSQDYRFSIQFPQQWESMSLDDKGSLGSVSLLTSDTDDFRENALVGSYPLEGRMPLLLYYAEGLQGLREEIPGLKVLDVYQTEISDVEAVRLDFTLPRDDSVDYRMVQMVMIKNDRAYILAVMARADEWDDYSAAFETIISSFRFEDGSDSVEE